MTAAEEQRIVEIFHSLSRKTSAWQLIVTQILIAIAPTLAAFVLWLKANSTHDLVNSRMTELLALTKQQGKQEGRDAERRTTQDAAHLDPVAPGDQPFLEALKQLIEKYEK